MDGTSGLPDLNNKFTKSCITVAAIGTTGGATTPTGSVDSHTLSVAELPAHFHYIANTDDTSSATPSITNTTYLTQSNTGGGNPQYDLNGSATVATVGKTSSAGSSSGHTHGLTMDAYSPPFYQLIKLVYLGY
jgi:microcystin-dependent protein